MPSNPYAQVQMTIDGGGSLFGGQIASGGNVIQLSGVSSVGWLSQLWEIYEYPPGYSLPSGWTNVNGVYQSSVVTPPTFTLSPRDTLWGKYLARLTVNGGLLNGVFMGPLSTQPLIDISPGLHVLSPNGLYDLGFGETNQFDAVRQWIGDWRRTLRAIEYPFVPLTTPSNTTTRIRRYSVATGAVRLIRGILKVQSADNSGAVRGEWEVRGGWGRPGGTLAQEYAPTVTNIYKVGAPGDPTFTLNGNTDVDLNVTGVVATPLVWSLSEFTL